jgi:hypothetical protein
LPCFLVWFSWLQNKIHNFLLYSYLPHTCLRLSPLRPANRVTVTSVWQRNVDSKIKRQIQADSSGNKVYAKDCKIYMKGSQNQWRNIKPTQSNFNFRQNYNLQKWLDANINRMPRSTLPTLLTKYAPRGIRNQDRLWRDSCENETGTDQQWPTSLKARWWWWPIYDSLFFSISFDILQPR